LKKNNELPEVSEDGGKSECLSAVLKFVRKYDFDFSHSLQVTRLALALFDRLHPVHKLGPTERDLLEYSALMHDVGWAGGRKGHHKTSQKMILAADRLGLETRDKEMVASVARYHRKALPRDDHPHYALLDGAGKRIVSILGGILRVADGLDRSHTNAVLELDTVVSGNSIVIKCAARGTAFLEKTAALKKADLLERVLECSIEVVISD